MKELHEAILTRELDLAGEIVRSECAAGRSEGVRDDILRFTVLAFAPSLHSRATMEVALAIADLFDEIPDPCPLLVEAARYAGESKVPWGKAPVTDAPPVSENDHVDDTTIDRAVASGDLRDAEHWLALVDRDDQAVPFFDAAARHAGPEGYGFTTAAAAWRIALMFPPFVRWAVLRMALLEWLQGSSVPGSKSTRRFETDAEAEVVAYVRERGGAERFQTLAVIDAIVQAEEATGRTGRYQWLLTRFASATDVPGVERLVSWSSDQLGYRYARDFGMFLRAVPISRRLAKIVDRSTCEKIPAAARRFLEEGDGFEMWSFA